MALTIFIKFCGFIEHSKPNNFTLSDFIEKFLDGKKANFPVFFCLGCNTDHRKKSSLKSYWDHKLLIRESYIENSEMVLEI